MKMKLKYISIFFIVAFSTSSFFGTILLGGDMRYFGSNGTNLLKTSAPSDNLIWEYTANEEVRSVAISASGNVISASTHSPDGSVYLFDNAASSSKVPLWIYNTSSNVYGTDISGDGDYITAVNDAEHVFMFNDSITSPKRPIWDYYPTGDYMNDVAISMDGNYVIAARYDGVIILLNNSITTPKTEMWNYTTGGVVWTVAISGDGNYIVTGSTDQRVYLFSKSSSTPLWTYSTGGGLFSGIIRRGVMCVL